MEKLTDEELERWIVALEAGEAEDYVCRRCEEPYDCNDGTTATALCHECVHALSDKFPAVARELRALRQTEAHDASAYLRTRGENAVILVEAAERFDSDWGRFMRQALAAPSAPVAAEQEHVLGRCWCGFVHHELPAEQERGR